MLDLITKSKVRQNILKLLFFNKNKSFYLSEIARIIDASSIGGCQRELRKLVKFGIIETEKRGNLSYYFLNKQNPLIDELNKIINKTIGIETELKKLIKGLSKVKYAFIFGSYVKGDFSSNSDIDLFIIGQVDENKLIKEIKKLEKVINREINYHLYSERDFRIKCKSNSFIKNITKQCLFLTNNEDELRKLFK